MDKFLNVLSFANLYQSGNTAKLKPSWILVLSTTCIQYACMWGCLSMQQAYAGLYYRENSYKFGPFMVKFKKLVRVGKWHFYRHFFYIKEKSSILKCVSFKRSFIRESILSFYTEIRFHDDNRGVHDINLFWTIFIILIQYICTILITQCK